MRLSEKNNRYLGWNKTQIIKVRYNMKQQSGIENERIAYDVDRKDYVRTNQSDGISDRFEYLIYFKL